MGKQQSKVSEEKIIIAQTGAGNNADAAATTKQVEQKEMEFYLIFITIFIVLLVTYFYWKKVKKSYGRFVRRELQLPIVAPLPRGEQGVTSFSPHQQQVIV